MNYQAQKAVWFCASYETNRKHKYQIGETDQSWGKQIENSKQN